MDKIIILFVLTFIVCQVKGMNLFKPDRIPRIDLGEVDLSDSLNCENQLKKHRYECDDNYREKVIKKLIIHGMDERSESVKREVCCGIWSAKACVIKAAMDTPDCDPDVANRYQALPTDPHIKEEVLDMCSEYGENTPICSQPKNYSIGFWFISLLIFLFLLILLIIALFYSLFLLLLFFLLKALF
jgi:hypothetical protein